MRTATEEYHWAYSSELWLYEGSTPAEDPTTGANTVPPISGLRATTTHCSPAKKIICASISAI